MFEKIMGRKMKRRSYVLYLKLVIVFLLVMGTSFSASEVDSEFNSQVIESEVVDIDGMNPDQIAKELDPNPEQQDFIILSPEQLKELKGTKVVEISAEEDFSVVNSSMWGDYGIYKVNGKYVFCVEPGYDTLNSANKVEESSSIYNKFAKSSQVYVSRVISSSLQHYKSSDNEDYIFAGQLLIWDYLSSHESDVIGNPMESWNPEYFESWTIHNSVYNPQIKVIEDDLATWEVRPSFLNPSKTNPKAFTLKYNVSSDNFSITLKDSNGVWDKKYANYSDFGDYVITNPSGKDNVKITTNKEHTSYSSAQKYTWTPTESDQSLFYDAGQDLVRVGADGVNGYLKVKTEKIPRGGFELKKVGEQLDGSTKPLAGVSFKVKSTSGSKFSKTYKTNDNGVIKTGNDELKVGDYHISEVSAPSGYIKNYEQDFSITKDGQVVNLNKGESIFNQLYTNKITFKKVGNQLDGSAKPLVGVKFNLYQDISNLGTVDESDKLIETLTSDESGIVESSQLSVGNYLITEIETNDGYVLSDEVYSFKIEDNGKIKDDQVIDLGTFENEVYTNKISFQKVGESQTSSEVVGLAGVEFGLYQEVEEPNGIIDESDKLIETLVSNDDGLVESSQLPVGNYIISESNTIPGYIVSDKVFSFEVKKDGQVENNTTIDLGQFENKVETGTASLDKVGVGVCPKQKDCSESLANVKFEIYRDIDEDSVLSDDELVAIDTIVTDENGHGQSGQLKLGHYYLKEVENPNPNYKISDTTYEFWIEDSSDVKINDGVAITNQEKLGQIKFNKSGQVSLESEETKSIEGAEYTLYDSENKKLETAVTDKQGSGSFNNLSLGTYYIGESKAPNGYVLDPTKVKVEVDEQSYKQPIELEFTDQLITNHISITKVDAAGGAELPGASLEVIDKSNDEVVESWISTDEAYEFEISSGDYKICESSAPAGYQQITDCTDFKVTKDGVEQSFKIENKRMKMMVTGLGYKQNLILILSILFLIVTIILYIRLYSKRIGF